MKLTVIRGIPGSGKSTYAKKNYSCFIVEQDMYFMRDGKYQWSPLGIKKAVEWCKNTARAALAAGMDVCVVNTSIKYQFVEDYAKMAGAFGASFEVVRMSGDYGDVYNVPAEVKDRMKSGFEDWPGEKIV